jgi:glycine oxidase
VSTRDGVLVIGAGLIGSSIAWRIAQSGIPTTVVHAGPLPGEASLAGAGMLAPASESKGLSRWLELGLESLRLYPGFVEELRTATGLAIEYRQCGGLIHDPDPALLPVHRAAEMRVEVSDAGWLYPDEAIVDPAQLLAALRHAAVCRGVAFGERRVLDVESREWGAVVVAAGAWSGSLRVTQAGHPVPLPPTKPVKGHLLGYAMPPGLLGPFERHGHTYVLQRADGFLIAGTTEEDVDFDARIDEAACASIHERAVALVPQLRGVAPVRRWIGFRPGPDQADGPILRRVAGSNVWLAYGHYRNGILLTPISAARIASEVVAMLRPPV